MARMNWNRVRREQQDLREFRKVGISSSQESIPFTVYPPSIKPKEINLQGSKSNRENSDYIFVPCPQCAAQVKLSNLDKHIRNVHDKIMKPGQIKRQKQEAEYINLVEGALKKSRLNKKLLLDALEVSKAVDENPVFTAHLLLHLANFLNPIEAMVRYAKKGESLSASDAVEIMEVLEEKVKEAKKALREIASIARQYK